MNKRLPYIILAIGLIGLTGSIIYLLANSPEQHTMAIEQVIETKVEKTEDQVTRTAQEKTGNTKIQTSIPNTTQFPDNSITVLMPGQFFNDARIQLAETIEKEKKITVNFQTIENIYDYLSYLQNNTGHTIDIFLTPTDRLESLEKNNIKKIS